MDSIGQHFANVPPRFRQILIAVAAFFTVTVLYWVGTGDVTTLDTQPVKTYETIGSPPFTGKLYGEEFKGRSNPDLNRVTNDTLGFSKIFVISLPERTDKRDAISLTAALTGFHVDFVDGVRGETIPDKAVPVGVDRHMLMETNLGSWRGHMNAIRRIVDEDLESALIMEDDMDWDVRLRSQLQDIARGTRTLLGNSNSNSNSSSDSSGSNEEPDPGSPYGDGWDILWIGHCGEPFPETLDENREKPDDHPGIRYMKKKYVIEDDETVPAPDRTTGFQDFRAHPHTRWVHVTAAPICTFAYAVSRRGAHKVLFDLSVDGLAGAYDNALAGLCRRSVAAVGEEGAGDRGLDARCFSVTPPVFFHHKARGAVAGDSDIHGAGGGDGGFREKGTTENIVWSARNNIRNMIMGTEMENQF